MILTALAVIANSGQALFIVDLFVVQAGHLK